MKQIRGYEWYELFYHVIRDREKYDRTHRSFQLFIERFDYESTVN